MTSSSFEAMNQREQRELARQLAKDSEVFDFEKALEIVQWKPEEAERLLRMRDESKQRQEELDRAYQRLHRAAQEFR